MLKAEVAMPPKAPPIVSGTTPVIEEVFDDDMGEEGDGELSSDGMDQAATPADDSGAGVGFITVQPRKKVKKGGLKQKEARNSRSFSLSHLKGMAKTELQNLIKAARAEISDLELEEGIGIDKEGPTTAPDISQVEEKTSG